MQLIKKHRIHTNAKYKRIYAQNLSYLQTTIIAQVLSIAGGATCFTQFHKECTVLIVLWCCFSSLYLLTH